MTEEYCEDCKGIEIESWVDGQLVIETGSKLCQYHGMIDECIAALHTAGEMLRIIYIDPKSAGSLVIRDVLEQFLEDIDHVKAKVKG